ncbi:hypothetical protein NPIL_133511 [Nephila pilipes]|uniref:Uncharacterized protein n=1 Tax=Nephila pilipes TaxID=299642 RepID=A0A8X6T8Q2_NEPPI|nr:hypothetical protein NPIL_133511 [Nephila pilipes]
MDGRVQGVFIIAKSRQCADDVVRLLWPGLKGPAPLSMVGRHEGWGPSKATGRCEAILKGPKFGSGVVTWTVPDQCGASLLGSLGSVWHQVIWDRGALASDCGSVWRSYFSYLSATISPVVEESVFR